MMGREKMVDIDCLACHEILDIPEWVPKKHYKGEIVCHKCLARLGVKFENSELQEYKVVKERPPNSIKWIVETKKPDNNRESA